MARKRVIPFSKWKEEQWKIDRDNSMISMNGETKKITVIPLKKKKK